MPDPANRKEQLRDLRPEEKYLDTGGSGRMAQDGYERICRRPRVRGFDECVPVERADRIEGIFGPPMIDRSWMQDY
jgi:hypothetical protein